MRRLLAVTLAAALALAACSGSSSSPGATAGPDYFVHVTRLVPWTAPADGTGALPPPVGFDTVMH